MTTLSAPLRLGPTSWLVPLRALAVSVAGLLLLGLLVALDLALGDFPLPVAEVLTTLLGQGDAGQEFIVLDLRLPQTLVAVLTGAALGLSGALTQTFARNPLASPDILGVTEGAAAGAVAVIVLTGVTGYSGGLVGGTLQAVGLPLAAFVGALLTATLLYVLSWRRGIDGQRLVLVGIGLGAALMALTSWLLVRARIEDAASAQVWLSGSLTGRGWDQATPLVWTLAVLVPVSLLLVRTLNALQLGDEPARGLGVRLQTTQLLTLLAAVGLAAVAVSAVGPLEFVAFVVPQVALRLVGGSRPPVVASMVYGACLVVGADLITRVVLPFAMPAGLVTAAIGAPYLIWLLLRANTKVTA
ncbi:iron chelate uptake ABC transporter family permease subunit [uncultured Nocardioides sp.]|uniref:ABC-type Fe3+-siderophore transport system, permease 2 component n=1 Tax=uncultured Nocardioides sp. TaxID=198441 RepID=A0A6J4NCU1_9ACTN|nr:iron chelate uptake ABC transporter family permease subunit [uncultured Nocardioides sp.]CAA9380817.1 MAG: ABC-type Fe3+-siderophore transport system, permease 2 component [uncultured Nocardioides sp.]